MVTNDQNRAAFTLPEILIVLAVIAVLVGVVFASGMLHAVQHRQVSEGARLLQAALVDAQARAKLTGRPCGIRLLPDPAFPIHRLPDGTIDPSYPLAANRWIPIEVPDDYTEGRVGLWPANQAPGMPSRVRKASRAARQAD
jgi:prepilin-type N-terminal cleavage/methylation domain-containing protein